MVKYYKLSSLLCFLVLSCRYSYGLSAQEKEQFRGKIEIPLLGVRHLNHGKLIVILYKEVDRVEMQIDEAFMFMKVVPKSESMSIIFENISYGEYALGVFHDLNDNGKLETNFIGFPQEDIGVSGNAKGGPFGGPKWEETKFQLNQENLILEQVQIFYFAQDDL